MNKIKKIIPINRQITFLIHLNNICNFKCTYCTAGHQTSKEKLNINDIKKIIDTILILRQNGDNREILIDLTGGEPTLNNELIEIIELFLNIDDVRVQVTTNLYRLDFFDNSLSYIKNIHKLYFNISYHYFEYLGKEDTFIKGLLILKKRLLSYKVKFLLPDSNVSLNEFLDIKKSIFRKSGINEKKCSYDLIINSNGSVSDSYSKDILDYFYNKDWTKGI